MYEDNNDTFIVEDTISSSAPKQSAGGATANNATTASNEKLDGFGLIFKQPGRLVLFIITIIVALTLIIGGIVLETGLIGTPKTSGTLSTYSPTEVYLSNDYIYYSFTPYYSGYYTFYSMSSIDTIASLRDAKGNELAKDDDSGENRNFSLVYYLDSNTTYYLAIAAYSTDGWAYIYVK